MPRSYRHILEFEKILEMKAAGKTKREICEKFGFSMKQITNFVTRCNTRQRRIEAGIALKRKGRQPRDYVVSEQDKVAEIKYILARKKQKIKSLEMGNELMQNFLSLTERPANG